MARSKPRGYHHGDLRAALIAASLAILHEDGVAALTLRSAARRAGVSHAAPKNHFADLAALIAAVAEAGFVALGDALSRASADASDPVARLLAMARGYVRFAVASPGHFRAMFHPLLAERAAYPSLALASSATLAVLADAVRAAQRAGALRAGDARMMTLASWSLVHGLATLRVDEQLREKGFDGETDALATRVAQLLLDGLAVPRGHAADRVKRGPHR